MAVNNDLDQLFQNYRGRNATAQERAIYENAPRDRLLNDLVGGYDPTANFLQAYDDLRGQVPQWRGVDENELRQLAKSEYGSYYDQLLKDIEAQSADKQKAHELALQYLSGNKKRGLGRLGVTRDTSLDRLQEDYTQNLDNLRRNINARGLYYSGDRTKQEGQLDNSRRRSESDINRRYDWGLQDINTAFNRGRQGEQLRYGGLQRGDNNSRRDLDRQRKYYIEQFMEGERQRRRQQFYDEQGYGSLSQ